MIDYKRIAFLFFFIIIFLIATDTQAERQSRKSLLSLFNIVVDEGSAVGSTAPSSFLDTMENIRISSYNYLNKEDDIFNQKSETAKTPFNIGFTAVYYIIIILKFICTYVITFYPFLVFLIYSFFVSPIFKRNDYPEF